MLQCYNSKKWRQEKYSSQCHNQNNEENDAMVITLETQAIKVRVDIIKLKTPA